MISRSGALAALVTLCFCVPAWAAPVTVQLRVEGATTTLFEAPVTTDGKTIAKDGAHRCDGTNNGANTTAGPTTITALDDGFSDWDGTFGDFGIDDYYVTRVGPDAATSTASWGIARNFTPLGSGGCQVAVAAGDQVLFAYDFFGGPPDYAARAFLRLTGPGVASVGVPVDVRIVNGRDGSPVAGASVAGATSGADGVARVTFGTGGVQRIKAEKAGAVRSNALSIAVGAAAQATAQVPPRVVDRTAPRIALTSLRRNARYRRGPRILAGSVADDGGILQAYFRLRRTARGGCSWYSAKRERFSRPGSCRRARFNRVGDRGSFSYLLPERLPRGRYLLEVKALDRALNVSTRRVRFSVR